MTARRAVFWIYVCCALAALTNAQLWYEPDRHIYTDLLNTATELASTDYPADTTLFGIPIQHMSDLHNSPTCWGAVAIPKILKCSPEATLTLEMVLQLEFPDTTTINNTNVNEFAEDMLIATFADPLLGNPPSETIFTPPTWTEPLFGTVVRTASPAGPTSLHIVLEVPIPIGFNDTLTNSSSSTWVGVAPTIPFGTGTTSAGWALAPLGPDQGYYFADTGNLLRHGWTHWTRGSSSLLAKLGIRGDFTGLGHRFRCLNLETLTALRTPTPAPVPIPQHSNHSSAVAQWKPEPMLTLEAMITTAVAFGVLCIGLAIAYHFVRFRFTHTRDYFMDVAYQDLEYSKENGLHEHDFHDLDSKEL